MAPLSACSVGTMVYSNCLGGNQKNPIILFVSMHNKKEISHNQNYFLCNESVLFIF